MAKAVEGSYETVEETIEAVKRLTEDGSYLSSDVVIITNEENRKKIKGQTRAQVDEASEDKGLMDKVKNMFTDDSNNDSPLEKYGIDPARAVQYNDSIKYGHYVVLVEGYDKEPNNNRPGEYPPEEGQYSPEAEQQGMNLQQNAEARAGYSPDIDTGTEEIYFREAPDTREEAERGTLVGDEQEPRLEDNRDDRRDLVTGERAPLGFDEQMKENPLQGENADGTTKRERPEGTSAANPDPENPDDRPMPFVDGGTLSNQPRTDPERERRS